MNVKTEPSLRNQAIRWAVLTSDPQFNDWDSFIAWLEADRARALAYDEVAGSVSDGASMMGLRLHGLPEPANDNSAPKRWGFGLSRPACVGGAAAALLAILAFISVVTTG